MILGTNISVQVEGNTHTIAIIVNSVKSQMRSLQRMPAFACRCKPRMAIDAIRCIDFCSCDRYNKIDSFVHDRFKIGATVEKLEAETMTIMREWNQDVPQMLLRWSQMLSECLDPPNSLNVPRCLSDAPKRTHCICLSDVPRYLRDPLETFASIS